MTPPNPLIMTKMPMWRRIVDTILTSLMWISFVYLIFAGLIYALYEGEETDSQSFLDFLFEDIATIAGYTVFFFVNGIILVSWAKYNQFRGRTERRTRRDGLTDTELSKEFNIPPETLRDLRHHSVVTIHNDEHGDFDGMST